MSNSNTSVSPTHYIKLPFEYAYAGIKSGVAFGAKMSFQIDLIKVINDTASVSLKAIKYAPDLKAAIPYAMLDGLVKDSKRVCNILMGLRSVDYLMEGAKDRTWLTVAMNVSGIGLFVLTVIDVAERFGVDVSVVHEAAKQVPIFGVLPFAGLLDLSLVGLYGTIFLKTWNKKPAMANAEAKLNQRIAFWQKPLDETAIKDRLQKYSIQVEDKKKAMLYDENKAVLQNVLNHINDKPQEIAQFKQDKEARCKAKLEKLQLEKHSSNLTMLGSGSKILSIIIVSGAIVSGAWIPAATILGLGLGFVKAGTGIRNYALKREIKQFQIPAVNMSAFKPAQV